MNATITWRLSITSRDILLHLSLSAFRTNSYALLCFVLLYWSLQDSCYKTIAVSTPHPSSDLSKGNGNCQSSLTQQVKFRWMILPYLLLYPCGLHFISKYVWYIELYNMTVFSIRVMSKTFKLVETVRSLLNSQ